MSRLGFYSACLFMMIGFLMYGREDDYSRCDSIFEAINIETEKIEESVIVDIEELTELYVSRGESYLLVGEHEKAIEDFGCAENSLFLLQSDIANIFAFRIAFGQVVSWDNLNQHDETDKALKRLVAITEQIGCDDCLDNQPCSGQLESTLVRLKSRSIRNEASYAPNFVIQCSQAKKKIESEKDTYKDIQGPDKAPTDRWCEEVVVGVGRAMDAIAAMAKSPSVRIALIGVIESLIQRGVKCCETGSFWKACVAPIARKWKEWQEHNRNSIYPNPNNMLLFIK